MTMFKKVFGTQMAAADGDQANDDARPVTSAPAEPEVMQPEEPRRAPRSKPIMTPVKPVLGFSESENELRRAENAKAIEEQLISRRPQLPSTPPMATRPPPPPPPGSVHRAVSPSAPPPPPAAPVAESAPLPRPGGRARTRLLGFNADANAAPNPMAGPAAAAETKRFPTGWIVVIEGPGQGHFFPIFSGVSTIGRDEEQAIALCFGDMTISRENHAAIAFDDEDQKFYVGHGGKSNIIRLNGRPVLSTEPLTHGDQLRVGETVLRFVAFCDDAFTWAGQTDG